MKRVLKLYTVIAGICAAMTLNAQNEQPMIGEEAPAFTLKSIDEKSYSLEQLKGKYVVLHFAATWCPFCNAEAPNLEELYKNYRDKGVEVFINRFFQRRKNSNWLEQKKI